MEKRFLQREALFIECLHRFARNKNYPLCGYAVTVIQNVSPFLTIEVFRLYWKKGKVTHILYGKTAQYISAYPVDV